ncbi:MAG: helix-turn-helix transcriptional regulator [Ilumatobacteraceae bacterium]
MTGDPEDEGVLPRSYLRIALLAFLAEGPAHGYDLLEQVGRAGIRTADAGGLYRSLRAMEHDGVVVSWWETSTSGPPRRTYELTPSGRDVLAAEASALRNMLGLLTDFVERVDEALKPSGSSQ